MTASIHPFPARMAPELALEKLKNRPAGAIVLDPMVGSGTVLRQAVALGHKGVGFDLDPLAVLMTTVATTSVTAEEIDAALREFLDHSRALSSEAVTLPWLDTDSESTSFVEFWFAEQQRSELRKLAYTLSLDIGLSEKCRDIFRLALSRTIITKERGASLARDVSHSRPHRVGTTNSFDVENGFRRAVRDITKRLSGAEIRERAKASIGDARDIAIGASMVDVVITSPPYLNAIDYMRGHRLSLVWLGYRLSELRSIRSSSIGAERAPTSAVAMSDIAQIRLSMGAVDDLPARFRRVVDRDLSP